MISIHGNSIKPQDTGRYEILKKLTVIIINYNTKDLLKKCLQVLDVENTPEDFQVLVVDNNSPDGSAETAKKIPGRFEVVSLNENRGFPYAANLGIKKSPAEFYLILNSDTEVTQSQIEEMLKFMANDPEIGAMTPFQLNNKNEPQLAWGCFPTFSAEIGRKILQDALDSKKIWAKRKLLRLKEPFYVHWAAGSTLLLRDDALQKSGLFDETFFIFYEDIDLCARIREAGWKIAVHPQIKAIHHRGESAKTDSLNASIHYRRSQLYFWKKHHGRLSSSLMKAYLLGKFRLKKSIAWVNQILIPLKREQYRKQKEDTGRIIEVIKAAK